MDRASIAPIFLPSCRGHTRSAGWWKPMKARTHDWVVGVQWHPERTFELSDPHLRLWQQLSHACTDLPGRQSTP